jgi:hypothetical protein
MSISLTYTAGEFVDEALKRCQILGDGQTASAYQWTIARSHINGLLKLLVTQGPSEWRRATQSPAMTASVAFVTCNPRPDRVHRVYYRNSSGFDLELQQWNMDDYDRIPVKTSTGRPTIFAVDRLRTETKIYLWPVPDATIAAGTLRVSYERVPEDVVNTSDILDVPQEWFDVFMDLVGGRTGQSLGVGERPPVAAALERGSGNLNELLGYDRGFSTRFAITTE